jgi:hypothetical protein
MVMDFKVGEGFRIEGARATLDLTQQPDDVVRATFEEAKAVGVERGLWMPGAGALMVASETPSGLRGQLLSTLAHGTSLYVAAINGVNAERDKKHQIPTLQPGEYRERAEDWLTDELVSTAKYLPISPDKPCIVIPRLTHPLTHVEIVNAWTAAAHGRLYPWSNRMNFLQNWTANQLSGFDSTVNPDEVTFQIIPTAYDEAREGTVDQQLDAFNALQKVSASIGVTALFDGAVLARRYMYQDNYSWQESYVRGINLEPVKSDGYDFVPRALVLDDGYAYVNDAYVLNSDAGRLVVR